MTRPLVAKSSRVVANGRRREDGRSACGRTSGIQRPAEVLLEEVEGFARVGEDGDVAFGWVEE